MTGKFTIKIPFSLIDVLFLLFCVYAMFGNTSNNNLYVEVFLFLLWFVFAFITRPRKVANSFEGLAMFLLIYNLFFAFICGYIGGDLVFSIKQFFAGIILFSPIILFNYYIQDENTRKIKSILMLLLFFWVGISIKAVLFYINNPGAARVLASDSSAYGDISIGGGYNLAYGSAMIVVVALSLLFEKRIIQKSLKIFWIGLAISGMLILFYTESTVTLIAFLTGVVAILLFPGGDIHKIYNNFFIKILILVIFFFVFICLSGYIGENIIKIANKQEGAYNYRLTSFGYALKGDYGQGNYTLGRIEISLISLKTFLSHPLFGVAYKHGNGFHTVSQYGVGNHCEWADILANYGIIGGLPLLFVYIFRVKQILNNKNKISVGWIVTLIILGLFNPFRTWQSNFVLFFVIPVLTILPEYSQNVVDNSQNELDT